jgi:GTP-sensing pleiotropic transcriptional regulator CodY
VRKPRDQLTLAAAELVRTEVGMNYLRALEAVVEESRENLVMAPLDVLPYAQGVARQGTVLLKQLRSAPEDAAKILSAEETRKTKETT